MPRSPSGGPLPSYSAYDLLPSFHRGAWQKGDSDLGYIFHHDLRFSLADVLECLRHKHILFIGDSITRYLFLSLVTVLETGAWPRRQCGDPLRPSPLYEGDFGTWYDLFKAFEQVAGDRMRSVLVSYLCV